MYKRLNYYIFLEYLLYHPLNSMAVNLKKILVKKKKSNSFSSACNPMHPGFSYKTKYYAPFNCKTETQSKPPWKHINVLRMCESDGPSEAHEPEGKEREIRYLRGD